MPGKTEVMLDREGPTIIKESDACLKVRNTG